MPNNSNVKSIVKAFAIMEELSRSGSMSIADLSLRLNMDKSTVHRLVNTIKEAGYITQDSKSKEYENGIKLFEIGQGVIERGGLSAAARPFIELLAEQTGETVNLALRMENRMIIIDKIESKSTIKAGINIGAVLPMHITGMGKAVLAYMAEDEMDGILSSMEFENLTGNVKASKASTAPRLDEVRKQGYAIDNEEYVDGLICIGAPIFDHNRAPVAAVSISFPSQRFDKEYECEYPGFVKEAALKISRHMGYR